MRCRRWEAGSGTKGFSSQLMIGHVPLCFFLAFHFEIITVSQMKSHKNSRVSNTLPSLPKH